MANSRVGDKIKQPGPFRSDRELEEKIYNLKKKNKFLKQKYFFS